MCVRAHKLVKISALNYSLTSGNQDLERQRGNSTSVAGPFCCSTDLYTTESLKPLVVIDTPLLCQERGQSLKCCWRSSSSLLKKNY